LDIGIEEYLDSGHYCMIEWPEIIKPLLPENALFIEITAQADKSRILQILSV
jgi:tRNA threonylcarbamoyladenosine biosynthesis protein TsaE